VSIGSEPQRPYLRPLLSKEYLRGEAGLDTAVSRVFPYNGTELVAGRLLPVVAAVPTSALIPLHTWLPDAMAGPTPVSPLVHAATMVTAVVYLIARMHRVFERTPNAVDIAAIGGGLPLLTVASSSGW
jgi:NADH-quinone oxidoreductase subunit L